MASAGTVSVDVQPNMAEFGNELQSQVVGSIKRIGVAIAGLAIGKQLFDFVKEGVQRFGELEVATTRTSSVLASTGNVANTTKDSIVSYAERVQNLTGVNEALTVAGENVLLGFRGVRNEVGKGNDIFDQARKQVTNLSIAMGVDSTSAAKTLGRALQDPLKGITSLKRANITFTDQQKDLIKWLVATGDTLGAQKVILDAVRQSVGGTAADYGTTLPAKLAVAEQAFADIKMEIAAALVPAIEVLAGWVTTLAGAFDSLSPTLKTVIGVLIIAGAAMGFLAGPIAAIAPLLGALLSPVTLVVLALAAIAAAAIYAYFHFQAFRDVVDGVVQWFKSIDWAGIWLNVKESARAVVDWFVNVALPVIQQVVQGIVDRFTQLAAAVIERWNSIQQAVSNVLLVLGAIIAAFIAYVELIWNTFGEALVNQAIAIWNFLASIIQAALQVISGYIDIVLGLLTLDFSRFWQGVQEIFQSYLTVISAVVTFAFETIKSYIIATMAAIGVVIAFGWAAIQAVTQATWSAILAIIQFAWAAITGAVSAAMSAILSVIAFGWSAIVGAITSAMAAVLGAISAGFYAAVSAVGSAMYTMVSAVNDGVTQILSLLVNLPGQAVSALGNLGSLLYGAGQALINGLLNGIKDAVSAVYNFVSSIAGKIASLKGPIEKDKVLLIPAGTAIISGLRKGIESEWRSLAKDLPEIGTQIQTQVGVLSSYNVSAVSEAGGDPTTHALLRQIIAGQNSSPKKRPSAAIMGARS